MENNEDKTQTQTFIVNGDCSPAPKEVFVNCPEGITTSCPRKLICISIISHCFVFAIGIALGFVINKSEQPHVCSTSCNHWCRNDSLLYKEKCYYFSEEEYNWTSSQNFCTSRNTSLARIENEEKDFVKRNMGNYPFWIGLRKYPNQPWKWTDGENATMKVVEGGGYCAYLHDFEKMEASSSRCSTEHRFICKSEEPQHLT